MHYWNAWANLMWMHLSGQRNSLLAAPARHRHRPARRQRLHESGLGAADDGAGLLSVISDCHPSEGGVGQNTTYIWLIGSWVLLLFDTLAPGVTNGRSDAALGVAPDARHPAGARRALRHGGEPPAARLR